MERREAQRWCLASFAIRKRIASRRSTAAILGEGSVLPGQDKRDTRLDPAGFRRPSSCPRPALCEQSHVVGPDADPSLPDDVCAKHARGRRILLRSLTPLESAPHEQDMANLSVVRSTGIAIPITKCCRRRGPDEVAPSPRRANFPPSFRGARLRANPESTATQEIFAVMDSGPAPRGASRNDG